MRTRFLRWFAVFAALGTAFVACEDNNLVNNPSFDLWCGDSLCGWQVDAGSIERVATWHKKDYGVSFEGAGTQISQLSEADPVRCMRFDMIADADPAAQLAIVLDFNDDGHEDFEQRITDVRWESVQFVVRAPLDYKNVRYILRKQSAGRAVLAQLRVVEETENCAGDPLLLPDGSGCTNDAVCLSGLCTGGTCNGCASRDGDGAGCMEGESCNEDSQCRDQSCVGGVCQGCAKDGTCAALTPCEADYQCASGSCRPRVTYSDARDATSCLRASEGNCGAALISITSYGACEICERDPFPSQCAECADDSQCASGICERGICADCRSDEQCPAGQRCRYRDLFDEGPRTCASESKGNLPRGALCESNEECAGGLSCGSTGDEAKRCGVACEVAATACGPGFVCTRAGFAEVDGVIWYPWFPQPGFADVAGRVATCHPVIPEGGACALHAECATGICCRGACMTEDKAIKGLRTGGCTLKEDTEDSE